ncbi:MAG: DUF2959 domain-containing protein [Methylococcaceae bacterium]|nr:DUF2959 domain-containing protein [Methylococcaceae bacterium]
MKPSKNPDLSLFGILSAAAGTILQHCRNAYRKSRDSRGYPKRDVVVYRVVKARDSLESAKTQFVSALEKFSTLTNFEGGSLKELYLQIRREFELSQDQAGKVSERIRAVEEVSLALFDEWQQELGQYNSRQLRSNSREQLKLARAHYNRLIRAMHHAEAKIKPVLAAFKDQVLFLNHSLNAQAIASLHHELRAIALDIASLIAAMEKSIVEANAFVNSVTDQKSLPCL